MPSRRLGARRARSARAPRRAAPSARAAATTRADVERRARVAAPTRRRARRAGRRRGRRRAARGLSSSRSTRRARRRWTRGLDAEAAGRSRLGARREPDDRAREPTNAPEPTSPPSARERRTVVISGHPDRLPVAAARSARRGPRVERIGAQPGPDRRLRGGARVPAGADRGSHVTDGRNEPAAEPCGAPRRRHTLISRKKVSAPRAPHTVVAHAQDRDEPVPHPRRPDGARGIAADPQGRVVGGRAASELPRRAGGRAGRAAGLHALPRGARHGQLPRHSAERIGLAVAEHYGSKPGLQLHTRTAPAGRPRHRRGGARQALGLRRRRARPRCCATCGRCWATGERSRSTCTRRRARRAGSDEQLLEAIAVLSHGILHGDGQRRRRRARRRLGRGDAGAARRVMR